ncbi:MAG: hypothetical protein ACLUIO_27285 [Neglectibacter timonensis]
MLVIGAPALAKAVLCHSQRPQLRELFAAICDPKSEILRKTGGALKANGYEVRVFDLLNPHASFC